MGKTPEFEVWTGLLSSLSQLLLFQSFCAWLLDMSRYLIEHCPGTVVKI